MAEMTGNNVKVEVVWGVRFKKGRYKIKAKTRDGARKEMNARPGKKWGRFRGSFTNLRNIIVSGKKVALRKTKSRIKFDKNGNVTKIKLTPWYIITMPKWPAYTRQSRKTKRDWDAMWKALMTHEEGHEDRFVKGFNELVRKLKSLQDAKYSEVNDVFSNVYTASVDEQKRYDIETKHGQERGVIF